MLNPPSTFRGRPPTVSYGYFITVDGAAQSCVSNLLLKNCAPGSTTMMPGGDDAGEESASSVIPAQYALHTNYPNPFNPTTIIEYDLPEPSSVLLKVFNVLGQEVAILVNATNDAGSKTIEWNAKNNSGADLPSGIYIYQLQATSLTSGKEFHQVRKMMLIR